MASTPVSTIANLRIEQALEAMSDAFVLLDPDFRILHVNPAAERAAQKPAHLLLDRSHWEAWPSSVGTEVERRYRLALATGEDQHFQHHFVEPGLDLWLDIRAYPSASGLAIYYRDITEQKLGQAAYGRIERAYKAALSNTPDLIYVFDLDHRFIYANEALLTMWGRTWDDAIGKNCLELGYPDWHAAMHDREIEQVIATRQPIRGEVPFTGTHGKRLYEYIFVPVIGARNEVESVAGTTRDITERQQTEQALRQSEKLAIAGRLATSISHEINNPLEAVTNLLYLIGQEPTLPPDTREYLETAQSELARVSEIATQTLRFYRQSTNPTPTSIPDLLDSVADFYERRLRQAEIQVLRRYASSPPITVLAGEVRQVVANLLGNAIDAIGTHGCIALTERTVTHPASGRIGILMSVSDSGHGMSPETARHAFDPFFTTKDATGTGLGLWVTKNIVEKHGGTIRVRSRQQMPYQGTTFAVFFPDLSKMRTKES